MYEDTIAKTYAFVKERLSTDKTGHDWWHVVRVVNLSRYITVQEPAADKVVVELGALLHDIADWKFHSGDVTAGPRATREWLSSQHVDDDTISKVAYIVEHISFRGGTNKHIMETIEGKIVQDADRLDAIGAIGIARTFTFGGAHGRTLYDPDHPPESHMSFDSYRKTIADNTTINHFYEKLLLLKDGMHTKTAKALAAHRHKIMVQFLEEFYQEWEGQR
jgi:uncharacterized protein